MFALLDRRFVFPDFLPSRPPFQNGLKKRRDGDHFPPLDFPFLPCPLAFPPPFFTFLGRTVESNSIDLHRRAKSCLHAHQGAFLAGVLILDPMAFVLIKLAVRNVRVARPAGSLGPPGLTWEQGHKVIRNSRN